MSWQVGAFGLLSLGLAAGFGWYERSRPDARTVALVGVLAALAALGRIAFAPLPNVKPTTDIVLIAGYTIGGGPGYVVGALAALTSNFFFGQGPWTPWQMAGWGLTGMFGGLLATGTGGRVGRRTLAVLCFAIGFAFTVLQDVGDWVTYSDHSLAQLGVYVGKGLGFDLIHAVGCAGFAIAFGPALVRMLRRFRRRMTVSWSLEGAGLGAPVLLVALLAGSLLTAHAARAGITEQSAPIRYLLGAQNPDGGFGNAPGDSSNTMVSGWAILALAAGEQAATTVVHAQGAPSAAQYLAGTVQQDLGDPGSVERTILAAVAAGMNPRDLGGVDLTAKLSQEIRHDGSVADQTNLTAFAVLALRAAGEKVSGTTIAWLLGQQDRDGGFNFATSGAASDVDDTAAVVQALKAAEGTGSVAQRTRATSAATLRTAVARAVTFISSQQNHDGGFPSQSGGASNAQSTAFAIQALVAAGVAPSSARVPGGATPVSYLNSLVGPSGAVSYAKGNNQTPVWVTAEAELALSGHALPIVAPAGAASPPAPPAPVSTPAPSAQQTTPTTSAQQPAPVKSAHAKRHTSHLGAQTKTRTIGAGRIMGWLGAIEGLSLGLAGK